MQLRSNGILSRTRVDRSRNPFPFFFLEFSFVSTIVYLREFEKDIRFVLFRELWRVDFWQKFQVLLETSFRCTNNFLEVVEKI